jgi:hypothetical protein
MRCFSSQPSFLKTYTCKGPGAHAAEVPQKIRKGDPRLGKRALTYGDHTLDGKVTAIFRYSNSVEQIARHAAHPCAGRASVWNRRGMRTC